MSKKTSDLLMAGLFLSEGNKKLCRKMVGDISKIKKQFNELSLRNKFSSSTEKAFFKKLDSFFQRADKFELSIVNLELISKFKNYFRSEVAKFFRGSLLINRGYKKPKGYPGDYEIIESMYNNKPKSTGFGLLLDKYFLNNDYVQAVRDRKDRMKEILKNYISSNSCSSLNILNLACGSCREIREIFAEGYRTNKVVHFILLDQERDALKFAGRMLADVPKNWKISFVDDNILNFLIEKDYVLKKYGKQDLIYSIGLADYLPNSVLGPMIDRSFRALKTQGKFIVAHKNVSEFSSPISDWGADWKFIPRTASELRRLAARFLSDQKYTASIDFEEKRRIFFINLTKLETKLR